LNEESLPDDWTYTTLRRYEHFVVVASVYERLYAKGVLVDIQPYTVPLTSHHLPYRWKRLTGKRQPNNFGVFHRYRLSPYANRMGRTSHGSSVSDFERPFSVHAPQLLRESQC
jgi:hypothetical protein